MKKLLFTSCFFALLHASIINVKATLSVQSTALNKTVTGFYILSIPTAYNKPLNEPLSYQYVAPFFSTDNNLSCINSFTITAYINTINTGIKCGTLLLQHNHLGKTIEYHYIPEPQSSNECKNSEILLKANDLELRKRLIFKHIFLLTESAQKNISTRHNNYNMSLSIEVLDKERE